MNTLSTALLAFFSTCLAIAALFPISQRIGLLDHPSARKQHQGRVPLIGGLAMFCGMAVTSFVLPASVGLNPVFIPIATLLVGIGALDDRFEISPIIRLLIQCLAILLIIHFAGLQLHSLGNLLGLGEVTLGPLAIPVTIFAGLSLLNAVNMLDGMDGLLGTLALISLVFFAGLALLAHNTAVFTFLLLPIACLLAFLLFNTRILKYTRARIFMGDAGSLLLGFLLFVLSIQLSQAPETLVRPVNMLWILAIPLFDFATVFITRLREKRPLFKPGHDHIHYHLLQKGLTVNQVLLVLSALAIFLGSIGIVFQFSQLPDVISFACFGVAFGLYLKFMGRIKH